MKVHSLSSKNRNWIFFYRLEFSFL